MLARLTLSLGLLVSLQVLATPASPAARVEFRNVMDEIALNSVTDPLLCRDSEGKDYDFTLRIADDPSYQEAFTVTFLQNGEVIRSTLVAYLGQAGYPLGQLQIVRNADAVIYQHIFDGQLDDVIHVETLAGTVKSLRYSQVLDGRSLYEINCVSKSR